MNLFTKLLQMLGSCLGTTEKKESPWPRRPTAALRPGEWFYRLVSLEIKACRYADENQLRAFCTHEDLLLSPEGKYLQRLLYTDPQLKNMVGWLRVHTRVLWDIENELQHLQELLVKPIEVVYEDSLPGLFLDGRDPRVQRYLSLSVHSRWRREAQDRLKRQIDDYFQVKSITKEYRYGEEDSQPATQ